MNFADLHPCPPLLRALDQRGYSQPTPVQSLVLAPENAGRDLLVSAQTGSGKTVAFGLASAADLLGSEERFGAPGAPLALVIAPTRELALQVQNELGWLFAPAGARVRSCVGGMEVWREARALAEGAHLVVGTPGRLCDHLERNRLDLSKLRVVVLDEADEMLDMGFREELERILRDAPKERRTLLFSATIPKGIAELASRYQRDALRVAATPPEQAHADIEYRAHLIAPREREQAVVNTLRASQAAEALVFCATREAVNRLQSGLSERGFRAVAISGELTQPERVRALKALRDGQAQVLVATDVAARGLDLPALDLVIHADLPRDEQVLQHRSGRTGRAGRKGVSVLLVPRSGLRNAERMFRAAKLQPSWGPVPTAEQIRALDEQRLVREIAALCEEVSEEDLAIVRSLLAERSPEQLAGALVRQHRGRLPAPEELPETSALQQGRSPVEKLPWRQLSTRPQGKRFEAGARESSGPRSGAPARRGERVGHVERGERVGHVERGERVEAHNGVWFRVDVGRVGNADPRWLVPLICKRGGVTNAEIGRIHILAKETRFLIAEQSARRFAKAVQNPDAKEPWRISPLFQNEVRGSRPAEDSATARPERAGRRADGPAQPPPSARPVERSQSRPERHERSERGERGERGYSKGGYVKTSFAKAGFSKAPRARTGGARKPR